MHEHKFEGLSGGGFDVVDDKLRDLHVNELISRGQENRLACKSLLGWKNASADESDESDIKEVKYALTEVINSRMYVKLSGK